MENWDEIRTAYAVARLGTVSAAADDLGVHRATVSRHIDSLESSLGVSLFHRHSMGYTPTEAGTDLLRVANATAEQFRELSGRIQGRQTEVSGELVITTVGIVAPLVVEGLKAFRTKHSDVRVRYDVSDRVYVLEYSEAHVAIRGGAKPTEPDNVVSPFIDLRSGLYAHRSYIESAGLPTAQSIGEHAFIEDRRQPVAAWAADILDGAEAAISSNSTDVVFGSIEAGLGVGFYPVYRAEKNPEMVEVLPRNPEWSTRFWTVTHVDLHRTRKVQEALRCLRDSLPFSARAERTRKEKRAENDHE